MNSFYKPTYTGKPEVFGKVLVLYGGQSSEREVSLLSGERVFKAMETLNIDAQKLDVRENVIRDLETHKPDLVFIALHGAGGEDGSMQAVLEFLNILYTGSGHAASALAMDKCKTKQVWAAVGLSTPDFTLIDRECDWQQTLDELGGDVFVKPAHEGSSIGMSRANSVKSLKNAYELASGYDSSVLVERRIVGAEYSVTILGGKAFSPIRLKAKTEFYDYNAKYISDETEYICPCGLNEAKERELRELCEAAFAAIGCKGWGRVDVMADEAGNFYLLEVNTVPGMTSHSLVPMAAKQEGLDFEYLVAEILGQALKRTPRDK